MPTLCRTLGVWVAALLVVLVPGCDEGARNYPQGTPEAVIESAVAMVEAGDVQALGGLIYADSDEMRAMLGQTGRLMASLQSLAELVAEKMPEELEQLRDRAADDADGAGLFDAFRSDGVGGREGAERIAQQIMADPFGWLRRGADRLDVFQTTDTDAILTISDMPGFGLPMRLEEDKWYIVLPLNLPGVGRFLPQSEDEWKIVGSVSVVFQRAVDDLAAEVESGRIRDLNTLTDKAVDKLAFPAAIAFAAYGKAGELRRRADGLAAAFRTRLLAWSRQRGDERGDEYEAPQSLRNALIEIARQRSAGLAEKRRADRPRFGDMSDIEFEEFVRVWLREEGLGAVDPEGPFDAEAVDTAIERWEAGGG